MLVKDMLIRNATKFPEKNAIIFQNQSITYKDLNERVNRLSNALIANGLEKGDRLGVLVHNSYQFVELYFAASKIGAIFCPFNNHLKARELIEVLKYSTPKALVFDIDFSEMVESLKTEANFVKRYIVLQDTNLSFADNYEVLISKGSKIEPSISVSEDDVMSIFFTSGTTGKPKGVMRTHKHILANIIHGLIEFKVGYNERVLILFPMYHISFEDNIGRCFFLPNTMIIRREGGFDPEEVLGLISKERITFVHVVPTMINAFLRSQNIDKFDLSSLKTIFYAGAPMPVNMIRRALEVFNCQLFQGYGLTESGPQTTLLRPEDHVIEGNEKQFKKLSSVGTAVVGVEVKVVDDKDNELPPGQVGEIIYSGEAIMKGYWQLPEETSRKLRNGWLHTGDLGMTDEDGYLYIVDRKDDLIISGGINIYPKEVEEILYEHPAIQEASVIGVPDEYWGETVKAIVVLKEGSIATEEEIIKFCAERLAGYKKPKSVEFWKELPKSPQGKILKRSIKDIIKTRTIP